MRFFLRGCLLLLFIFSLVRLHAQYVQMCPYIAGSGQLPCDMQGSPLAVSADGSTMAAGYSRTAHGGGIFVYRLNNQQWQLQQQIVIYTAANSSVAGCGLAFSANGNTLAVSKPGKDSIAIYVFENGQWQIQSCLYRRNNYRNTFNNVSLSYDGNTLACDARIWVKSGTSWDLQATLTPTDRTIASSLSGDSANQFSPYCSMALSADGNTAVVGDIYGPDTSNNAWVFVRNGTAWTQEGHRLEGLGGYKGPNFLTAGPVSISGDGLTIGLSPLAYQNTVPHSTNGVWVFHKSGNVWISQTNGPLVVNPSTSSEFGGSNQVFSYDGNKMLVVKNENGFYYWQRAGSIWQLQGNVVSPVYYSPLDNLTSGNNRNSPLEIVMDSGGTKCLLGSNAVHYYKGYINYFTLSGNLWSQSGGHIYAALNTAGNINTNYAVLSKDGSTLVQSNYADNGNSGAAWIFTRNGSQWLPASGKLNIADTSWQPRLFGLSLAVSADGSTVAIGAPYADVGIDRMSGVVKIYARSGNSYVVQADSLVNRTHEWFGNGVALSDDGNTLLVGNGDTGAVVFVRSGNIWSQQAFLNASCSGKVAISGDGNTAVVADIWDYYGKGSINIFRRTGTNWLYEVARLKPNGAIGNFPTSLSLSDDGNKVFAGLTGNSNGGNIYRTRRTSSWSLLDTIVPTTPYFSARGQSIFCSATADTITEWAGYSGQSTVSNLILHTNNNGIWSEETLPFSGTHFISSLGLNACNGISGDLKYVVFEHSSLYPLNDSTATISVFQKMPMYDSLLLNKPATCAQVADGKIRVLMQGGPLPYAYNWSNGVQGQDSIINLLPGSYSLTVSDAAGDTIIRSYTVGLVRNFNKGNYTSSFSCASNTGTIKLSLNGGTAPFNYIWSTNPVQTADSATNLVAGTYVFTATDASGCQLVDSAILPAASYWSSITYTQPDCSNNGEVAITLYGGQPPYTYAWNNGANTDSISSLGPGNYSATVTDATGCSAAGNAVLANSCSSHISGKVFFDRNNNCRQDGVENSAVGYTMMATDGIITAYGSTDDSGHYDISVPYAANYTVSIAHWQECAYLLCTGINYPAQATIPMNGVSIDSIDFPLLDSGIDLAVEAQYNEPYPGATVNYVLYYGNLKDSIVPTGVITMVYDNTFILNNTIPAYTTLNALTHTITWNINNIGMLHPYSQMVQANFTVPANVLPHTLLFIESSIAPTTFDCDIQNNTLLNPILVLGSLDPNYKVAYPENHIYLGDSIITYTIHFQNTGVDSTHFIEILDTLSPYLDAASVRTVATFTHPYSFTIKENGILDWKFNPYALVDSTTDPVNSQGFVTFQVKVKDGVSLGTSIDNTASIYFDYNTPVQTNQVHNLVQSPNLIPVTGADVVNVYPNPFSSYTTFWLSAVYPSYDLVIEDMLGQNVLSFKNLKGQNFQLNRSTLASGCYLFKISTGGKVVGYGKLVAE